MPEVTSVPGVTRAQVSRPVALSAAAVLAVLGFAGCSGDDDDTTATTAAVVTQPPIATQPTATSTTTPVVTQPTTPVTSAPTLVTEGATVVVANASSVNGAAGRMSDELAAAGFTTGEATNSSESLATTKVYYNASVPEAEAVANSIVAAMGGGDIVAEPLPTPAPLDDPESIGDATVLVALGEDAADRTLAQLQSGETATATTAADSADTTAPPTSAG